MIVEAFKDVTGNEHNVRITPEWDVIFDDEHQKKFTSPIGSLIVATVVTNFDTITDKSEIQQLSLETYLELLENGYTVLDPSPSEFTQKEVGDKFDAFIRKRDLPLRQNVYHIGKLAFKRIMFLRDPTNTVIAGELFESAVTEGYSEDGKLAIIDSYNVSFLGKRNKYALGQSESKASEETLAMLNRGVVDVSTRATIRNLSKENQQEPEEVEDTENTELGENHIVEFETEFPAFLGFSNVTEYGDIAYRHLEALSSGREINESGIKEFLVSKGFNPRTEDIESILIFAKKNDLGTFKDTDRSNDGGLRRITFIKK